MLVLKIIGSFIIGYLLLFCIIMILRNILIFFCKRKKEYDKKQKVVPMWSTKKEKEVKKIWNETLGVWEIE